MFWQEHPVLRTRTVVECLEVLDSRPEARVIAGGTDCLVHLRRSDGLAPVVWVDITQFPELAGIDETEQGLVIGACTTHAALAASPLVRRSAPALAAAARTMASPQVRAMGTVGGNFVNASPAADLPLVFAALDAVADILGPEGVRQVPAAELVTGPGRTALARNEILARLRVPRAVPGEGQAFVKFGRRSTLVIAVVSAAARVVVDGSVIEDVSLVMGAVAPMPLVSSAAKLLLAGRRPDELVLESLARAVKAEVRPIDDLRATAGYRTSLSGVLAVRAVEEAYHKALAAQAERLERAWDGGKR